MLWKNSPRFYSSALVSLALLFFFLIDIVMLESLVSFFNNVNYYMVSSVSVQDPNPAL